MRIKSPVGEYEYQVTAVRFRGGSLEVDGSLGQWQTTMVVEPSDFARIAKGLAPLGGLLALAFLLSRRR